MYACMHRKVTVLWKKVLNGSVYIERTASHLQPLPSVEHSKTQRQTVRRQSET